MFNKGLATDEKSEGLLKRLKNIEDKTDNQLIAIENNIGNQQSTIKDGINNQPLSIKGRKISNTKKFKFRDANGNEIITLKNILKEKIFLYKQGQQKMESLFIKIITLVIIQTCGHL